MGKLRLKSIITLAYSAVISVLFYLTGFLISLRISFNIKETFFLIGLVLVLVGIVTVIAKNQNWSTAPDTSEAKEDRDGKNLEKAGMLLLGFNGFTLVFTGVFLLVIDALIK